MTDVFSDGQRLDASFVPSFSIYRSQWDRRPAHSRSIGGSPDLVIDLTEIGNDTNPATDGTTRLVFNVSQALLNAGATDGVLQGGRSIAPDAGSATGTLRFRSRGSGAFLGHVSAEHAQRVGR